MRVAIIGGYERGEASLARVAEKLGHELEFHPGHVGGRGSDEIRRVVSRADLVVIVTDVNSHGAVKVARTTGLSLGRQVVLKKRIGMRELERLLEPPQAA